MFAWADLPYTTPTARRTVFSRSFTTSFALKAPLSTCARPSPPCNPESKQPKPWTYTTPIHEKATAIVELKHWESSTPSKNEMIILHAKLLDYLAANPILMLKDICPIFMSVSGMDESGLAVSLGLGIHPIGPCLRPLPILIDSTQRMEKELTRDTSFPEDIPEGLQELWSSLNSLSIALDSAWVSSRCGYLSENSIVVNRTTCENPIQLGRDLREANGQCCRLLERMTTHKRNHPQ